ncbi:MAG: hypothetical protein CMG60_05710 [Candidatus Marinimicrobia bacterium]|nr:hypothetical protein [Candidatus Neomarinimicrobiota bacterium]
MLKKLFTINIILTLFATVLLGAPTDDLFTKKKIQIDDRFRGMGLDPSLYHIWIGTRADANLSSKYRIEDKQSQKKQKEYIPGLPTIPTSPKTEKASQSKPWNEGYVVYLYIDPSYDTIELKNSMDAIIKTEVWPALNHCDDCVQFEVKELYKSAGGESSSGANAAELAELEEKLKEFQGAQQIQAENQKLSERFEELEMRLQEITDANIALERTVELAQYELEEKEKELIEQEKEESSEEIEAKAQEIEQLKLKIEKAQDLEMLYYKEKYAIHNAFQDSLLKSYGQKVDQIHNPIEGCMNPSARNFNPRANTACVNCCIYESGAEGGAASPFYLAGCTNSDALNYQQNATDDDGSCKFPEPESNLLLWVVLGLLIFLILLSLFIIVGNKKKVVYLKPKEKKQAKNKNKEEGNEDGEDKNPPASSAPQAPIVPPTTAPLDEGVLQSEVQKQRQSAVAMSAGQKEGATQILKDWLDESKNEEENTEE